MQGQKGDKLLAESGDAPSRWLWAGFSTKVRKRRQLQPAKRLKGRPKGGLFPFDHVVTAYMVATRCEERGVEYRPETTKNGHMERGNPPRLSQVKLEQATRPQALTE